ncbi:MAG: alpha/beta fold hydrolase [Planctomycetota bacterium]
MAELASAPRPRRRARRWLAFVLVAGLSAWAAAIACGMNPSVPSDFVLNLWPVPAVDPQLLAPADARQLVVVQHGLWRSAFAMGRLERALRAHGYEVLNVSYPSTAARIEDHAAALAAAIDAYLARETGPKPCVSFVGHSLGGLVIRAYLARADAVAPAACVFVATPHRGAQLAARRQNDGMFRLFMGDLAAKQLVPGNPFFAGLRPLRGIPVGTLVGGKGDGVGFSASLPGDDDGTVTVDEAHADDETDSTMLPLGHTRLGFYDAPIARILHFLRRGRFHD